MRRVSTAEDFELQVRRLDAMGKIIDTLTTMLTKPPQPQGSATENVEVAAGCVSLRGKHDQFTVRKVARALRLILRQTNLEKPCSQPKVKKTHEETTE